MATANDMKDFVGPESQVTAIDSFQITASVTDLAKPVRAIRCEGAGTLTVVTLAGATRTLYFKDGETRFVGVTRVTAIAGPTFVEGMV